MVNGLGSTQYGMKSHCFTKVKLIFPRINQIMYLGLSKLCIFVAGKVIVLIIKMPTTIGYLLHWVPFVFDSLQRNETGQL